MNRWVLLLVAVVLIACGDDPGQEGDACTAAGQCEAGLVCRPTATGSRSCQRPAEECGLCAIDQDCRQGFFCVRFSDGNQRCGSGIGATTCRIP